MLKDIRADNNRTKEHQLHQLNEVQDKTQKQFRSVENIIEKESMQIIKHSEEIRLLDNG